MTKVLLDTDNGLITDKTVVTPVGTDHVLIADASDSGNLKKALISGFASAGGDMTSAVYDPTTKAADAFAMDNMVEGTTTKILTSTERTAISNNTAKDTNVSTNLSAGTRTATTIAVNSSDGTNATLVEADTTNAGILGSDKWDEIVSNTAKVSNATHTGDVTGATALTIGTDKVLDSHINFGTGATQVSTADLPEQTNLYYTESRVTANTNVSANTTHKSSDGSDHTFINQNVTTTGTPTFGITTLGDSSQLATSAAPTADADIANKKYVDDNAAVSTTTSMIASSTESGGILIAQIRYVAISGQDTGNTRFFEAGTLSNFHFYVGSNSEDSDIFYATLQVNGIDTAVELSWAPGITGVQSDTSTEISIAAGDYARWKCHIKTDLGGGVTSGWTTQTLYTVT